MTVARWRRRSARRTHLRFTPLDRRVHLCAAAVVLGALAAAMLALPGCTSWRQADLSQLSIRSQAPDGPVMKGAFDTAVYAYSGDSTLTVVLLDGPIDAPRQAVTLRMFWRPMAGRTPISSRATNATVHYLVFNPAPRPGESGAVAVYSGAGYLFPRDDAGDDQLAAALWDATVVLEDRSELFQDVLGPAAVSGRFTATHDEARTLRLIAQLGQTVSDRLGYPRLVQSPAPRPLSRPSPASTPTAASPGG